jgi:hypothetical protein
MVDARRAGVEGNSYAWLPSYRRIRELGLPAALSATRVACGYGMLMAFVGLVGFVVMGRKHDIVFRLAENRLFIRGIDPLQVIATCHPLCNGQYLRADSGQMPWAYPIGLLLVPPIERPFSLAWFFLLNVAAIASLVWWQHRPLGGSKLWSGMTGFWICACFPLTLTLFYGNYALIATALIAMSMFGVLNKDAVAPGILLGLATVKPHLALPFFLVLLMAGRWKALASAVAVPLISSVIFTLVTGVNAVDSTRNMVHRAGQTFGHHVHFGFLDPLRVPLGWSPSATTTISAGIAVALLFGVLFRLRSKADFVISASGAAAVTAAIWSYHRRYDFVVLVILYAAARHYGLFHVVHQWQSAVLALAILPVLLPTRERDWFRFGSTLYICSCIVWMLAAYVICSPTRKLRPITPA